MSTVTDDRPVAPSAADDPVTSAKPVLRVPITLTVLGVIALVAFGIGSESGLTSTFALSFRADAVQLSPLVLATKATCVVLSLICLAIAAYSFTAAVRHRRTPLWLTGLFGIAWVFAFLVWAVAGKSTSLVDLLQGSLLLAVPIAFGAFGGVFCERAGVVNIAIEGQLLVGAFAAAVVATVTGNVYLGLLAAPIAGWLLGLLLALFTVKYAVNQIIVGVVLNVLAVGLTSFFYTQVLAPNQDTWNSPPVLDPVKIPLLGDIPIIGPILFNQSVIVYLMYVIVAVVQVALFRTRWGLRVRAVGEHPQAADTVGIAVNKLRFRNVLLGAAVAGLGGAYFTIGSVGAFGKEMTAGKGFIALAAMIFGRWSPLGALGAALLFGFADNLQSLLSIIGTPIPSQFMLMAPYLATILAVAGLVGKVRAPAADGIPYRKS